MRGTLTEEEAAKIYREALEAAEQQKQGTFALNRRLRRQASIREDYERSARYARSHAKSKAQKKARKIQRNH